ncbi:MbtH family protein [Kitasatospora sp. NPDC052896]|uniref:MbtH family protein n=1 Tax=Kitasatospora sp. NPDC052896 TaxID=3364061 RepID=UPI0037C79D22
MPSPFDPTDRDDRASHLVLVNASGQSSLWPAFARTPAGWTIALPATTHHDCLAYLQGEAR